MRAGETLYLPFGWWHQVRRMVGLMLGHHGSRRKRCFFKEISGIDLGVKQGVFCVVCHLFERVGCLRMLLQRRCELLSIVCWCHARGFAPACTIARSSYCIPVVC